MICAICLHIAGVEEHCGELTPGSFRLGLECITVALLADVAEFGFPPVVSTLCPTHRRLMNVRGMAIEASVGAFLGSEDE
jgi:hypothetical protein